MTMHIIKEKTISAVVAPFRPRYTLLAAAMLGMTATAYGASYEWNGWDITFDSTLSAGATMRTKGPESKSTLLSDEVFDKSGDVVSAVFRGTHDLDIHKNNSGFFARATYLYDPVLRTKHGLPDKSKRRAGRDFDLLDAFAYTRGSIGNVDVYARLGSQVVSWGESTFFVGGINTFNPVDVTKSRLPGAEVKEMLTPVPVVLLGASLTQNWSVEGFAQLHWDRTELDPVGTFFNTNDVFGPGAREFNAMGMPKTSDHDASNTGAFGLSTRYLAESLGYTEFGLYYMQYNSAGPFLNLNFDNVGNPVSYFEDFPEDIRLSGLSFNTGVGAWSVQGEASYRDNLPIATSVGTLFAGGPAWERHGYTQTQITGTRVLPPNVIPTTAQTAIVIEAGYNHIKDFNNELKAAGVTKEASAIRAMLVPEWNDVFSVPGVGVFNVVGTIDYQYGIDGVGPAGGSNFMKGAHMLNLAVETKHQDKFSLMLAYHKEWGANDDSKRNYNPNHDRDYMQIVAKYSF